MEWRSLESQEPKSIPKSQCTVSEASSERIVIDAKGRCRWTRSAAKTLARRVNGTSATKSYGGRVNDERVVGKPSLNGSEMDKDAKGRSEASDQAPQKEALHEKPSKPNAFG